MGAEDLGVKAEISLEEFKQQTSDWFKPFK